MADTTKRGEIYESKKYPGLAGKFTAEVQIVERWIGDAHRQGWTQLALEGMGLTSLPEALGKLTQLKRLFLGNNSLISLPDALAKLTELEQLFLHYNLFTSFPSPLEQLVQLKHLVLSNNQLTRLPVNLTKLILLQELSLSNNQLTALPPSFEKLSHLHTLNLSNNRFTSFPERLCQLSKLRALDLSNNGLYFLPKRFNELTQLQELYIFNNQLTSLPEDLGKLAQLRKFSVSNNRITRLPTEICQLDLLQEFSADSNKLTSLPKGLHRLGQMRKLALHGNQLGSLPESLLFLAKSGSLKELYLHGNQSLGISETILGSQPQDLFENHGNPARALDILEYYFAMRGGVAKALRELKVILVGRGEVGKTTLAEVLQGKPFVKGNAKTEGIAITPWEVDLRDGVEGGKATAHLWDFGGQQIMHGTHQFFMTHRALYVVVLDGRDDRTKQEAEYWLKLVRAFGGDESPVMVVLNKQGDHAYDIDREYFAKKYKVAPEHFYRTECKDAKDAGIVALRNAILAESATLLAKREGFPGTWWTLKERLSEMRARKEDFLSQEDYQVLCKEHGVESEKCASLLRILSELGVVVSFPDEVALAELLVLNPEWATDGVYRVLNDRQLVEREAKTRGQVSLADVKRILPAERWREAQHRQYLLRLMEKFELCFPMEGRSDTVLVPELLPDATPNLDEWDPEQCLVFLYRYPALPQGVLPRLITRTHEQSEGLSRWRSGVILAREGAQALVRADYDANEVSIWVKGAIGIRRRMLLGVVRDHLEVIHSRIKNLGEEALLTVPGHPEVTVPLEDVLLEEDEGRKSMRLKIDKKMHDVPIKDLLEGVDVTKDRQRRDLQKGPAGKRRTGREAPMVQNIFNGPTSVQQANENTHRSSNKVSNISIGASATISGIIGDGNTIGGNTGNTQTFTNCFNTVQSLSEDKADLKAAMQELLEAVRKWQLEPEVDAKAKTKLDKNLEALTKETTAEEPDKPWLQLSGKGLIDAANTCAKMSGPVVAAVTKVLEFFS